VSGRLAAASTGRTLYSEVVEQIEAIALARPLGEETMLPAEWELAEQLGVSRGTLRRALAELEAGGLVRREIGRGTFVNPAARLRRVVWERLAEVALPDSRFGYDFSSFVPDFAGSERCAASVRSLDEYRRARTLVVTPDNSLERLREQALEDGKRLVVFTYGMLRGARLLDPAELPPGGAVLAATLDGMERAGRGLDFAQLLTSGPIDLVVTGAAAVSREGVHFGKGHGYFDLEWGLLSEVGLVDATTPVVAVVHDCQVVPDRVPHAELDAICDVIVTPSEQIRCEPLPKPSGLVWDRVPRQFLSTRPYLRDARQASRRRAA